MAGAGTFAGSYEVQITQGDPTLESNWKHALTALTSTHITLNDMPLMQVFWVRVRGIGSTGVGIWSTPLNIIVV
jgi:hypothetical protein